MYVMKKNYIGPLYSETKKMKVFWIKKKFKSNKTSKNLKKITKQSNVYRGYASTYNVKILISFNLEL